MDEAPIRADRRDGYHVVMLNRPDKLNAFNVAMHEALQKAFKDAQSDESCRAVLLTGAGRAFCAGQDLADRAVSAGAAPPDLGETLKLHYGPTIAALRALPMPIVCAVNGVAAGAGANIALLCDIIIAAQSAKFIQAFAKIGLAPDSGGTWSLTQSLGPARAMGLALTAEPLGAQKAADWGLIYKCVADDALMLEAENLCQQFASGPATGLAAIKMLMRAAITNDFDTQLELERETQARLGKHPDYREGVSAFMEKRIPRFGGRT